MDDHKQNPSEPPGLPPSLPADARLPVNRCNLPPVILGSLTFQQHPVALLLDGVLELHSDLFHRLDKLPDHAERAQLFQDHMDAEFSLGHPEEAGYSKTTARSRAKASYLRLLRGWAFDSDGIEGAALKGWVESRFGLLPRHHGSPIRDFSSDSYQHYIEQRARGLYGANALESQLDLVYSYCQYELGRQFPDESHMTLYRGMNRVGDHEILGKLGHRRHQVLLNNLSSFSTDRERASEFGDYIVEMAVPLAKIAFFHRLLPGRLKGEDEFVVIGGVYEVCYATL